MRAKPWLAWGVAGLVLLLSGCQAWKLGEATTPSPTVGPTATATPRPSPTPTPDARPCLRAGPGLPVDVTVPDDTHLAAGQDFLKIWRIRNIGRCPWDETFQLVWVSGAALGQSARVPLPHNVPPGGHVDIAVPMTAPPTPGLYHSNWMLRSPDGQMFGFGPDGSLPIWVRIWVGGSDLEPTPATPRPPTAAPPTATPESVLVHETRAIRPGTALDLDALTPDGTADLKYAQVDGQATLIPVNGARLAVLGLQDTVAQVTCQDLPKGQAPLPLAALPLGTWLCYATNEGHVGALRLVSLDPETGELTLEFRTWASP
ncbi:MAG: hypothetical protein GXO54_01960 [Chloroflexi bacterium]|nr:hypothetical protein [Chloroflexota bacterium]